MTASVIACCAKALPVATWCAWAIASPEAAVSFSMSVPSVVGCVGTSIVSRQGRAPFVSAAMLTPLRPAKLLTRLNGRASFFGVGLVHVASLFFLPRRVCTYARLRYGDLGNASRPAVL